MSRGLVALGLVVGYFLVAFFASMGIYHLFGLFIQALFVPVFFVGGLFVGGFATAWYHR